VEEELEELQEKGSEQARLHALLLDKPLVDRMLPGLDTLRHSDWGPEQYDAMAAITAAARNSRESDGEGGFYGHTFALTPTHVNNLALWRGWNVRKTIALLKVLDSRVKSGLDQSRLHAELLDMQLVDGLLPGLDTLRHSDWGPEQYDAMAAITAAARNTRSSDGKGGFYGRTFALTPTQVAHIAEVRGWNARMTIAQLKALDGHVNGGKCGAPCCVCAHRGTT
jgi:hypothetical protein